MRKGNFLAVLLLALTGCGGGGGDTSAAAGSDVTPTSAPTAVIAVASTSKANDLSVEVRQAAQDIAALALNDIPGAVSTLPAGVTTTQCTLSGNYTVDTQTHGNSVSGLVIIIKYNDCKYGTADSYVLYTGSIRSEYQSYTDAQNFVLTWQYIDFTIASHATGFDYTFTMPSTVYYTKAAGGQYTFYYGLDNGAIDIDATQVVRSGGNIIVQNATYTYSSSLLNNGVVRVVFTNWTYNATTGKITAGSITISGINNTMLKIKVDPANADQLLCEFTDASGTVVPFYVLN